MTTSQKPPDCRINCGGSVPPPPAHAPHARMRYNCGLARFGNCPAIKSIDRARHKRRRHRFGLWRRSRREHRQRAEAMAIVLEFPDTANTYPDGAADPHPAARPRDLLRRNPLPLAATAGLHTGSPGPVPERRSPLHAQITHAAPQERTMLNIRKLALILLIIAVAVIALGWCSGYRLSLTVQKAGTALTVPNPSHLETPPWPTAATSPRPSPTAPVATST